MNNVKSGRKPVTFGNKPARKWDGRRVRSDFKAFDALKSRFESALHNLNRDAILIAGQEIMGFDVGDFNRCEILFYNAALPRIQHIMANDVSIRLPAATK